MGRVKWTEINFYFFPQHKFSPCFQWLCWSPLMLLAACPMCYFSFVPWQLERVKVGMYDRWMVTMRTISSLLERCHKEFDSSQVPNTPSNYMRHWPINKLYTLLSHNFQNFIFHMLIRCAVWTLSSISWRSQSALNFVKTYYN